MSENNGIEEFCYEKDILKKAIKILKKYKTPNNLRGYPNYEVGLEFLEKFELDFIFGA